MRSYRLPFIVILSALALLLSACGTAVGMAPTPTLNPDLSLTAAALFPTPLPTLAPTATPVARGDAGEQIAELLGRMENAVLTQNADEYLSYVDLSDPVFALEHTRWVDDWAGPTLISRFDLNVRNLSIDGDTATASMTMTWTVRAGFDTVYSNNQVSRGADLPVRFNRGEDGAWRYAGEAWGTTLEDEHFRVYAVPGLEAAAEQVMAVMPDVYDHVTTEFGHAPEGVQTIKLYDNRWAMVATIRLDLPEIVGWNEPGESLKMVVAPDEPPDLSVLAHEFAHFAYFDQAGTSHGSAPWWLTEGAAVYAGANYWTLSDRNNRLRVVQDWAASGQLVAWDEISDFERTPEDLWRYVYPQGYVMVWYVTEVYGQEARNAWIAAMAEGTGLAEATRSALGVSFGELDDGFRAWLEAQ